MSTQNTMPRAQLLGPEWIAAIEEELNANPAGVPFTLEPDLLGRYDAEHGLPCDPLARGYRNVVDCEAYVVGYKEVTALWAEMVTEYNQRLPQQTRLLTDEEIEAELDDLRDYQEDVAWMRGGM